MADSHAPYRKLPGRGSSVVSTLTLWLGDTHLLQVNSWPAGESYRRFFFADIQAIIVRRTNRRMVANIVLGVLLLLIAGPLAVAGARISGEPGLLVTAGFVAGVLLLFILINSLLGTTCTMHIQTAIQCEPIPTVRRLPRARRIIALLQPRIAAAQNIAGPVPETT